MSEKYSAYYDRAVVADAVEGQQHREIIGGMWEEIGTLQMDMLLDAGLQPQHRLLDIGCGSLRLGVKAASYLDPENYWGTDLNENLLDAGYEREIIPLGLRDRLPRENLVADEDFDFTGVPDTIDFAIAQSVFTHLPLSFLRKCLKNLAGHLKGEATLFVTVFLAPEPQFDEPLQQSHGGVTTFPNRDPYHYTLSQLTEVTEGLPWHAEFIGEWHHPRNQQLVKYRLEQDEI
ncbi:MAG: methyltransferase type 12 [Henriciella sp.]|jgi:cyclopropane fatty-acyl-phospholipid synthase-like methyltransferase|nr:class I SAM-dependent methyltransferase [Henriciella sp.]MBK74248.1 methyltransferase type 12 [Henriciella sp.]|tara:strand:- start:127 stop:822 length:696 start_codon:yes stop_codon:yes gene_type:complete